MGLRIRYRVEPAEIVDCADDPKEVVDLIKGLDRELRSPVITAVLADYFKACVEADKKVAAPKRRDLVPVEVGQMISFGGANIVAKVRDDRGPIGRDGEHVFKVDVDSPLGALGTHERREIPHSVIRAAWWEAPSVDLEDTPTARHKR